MANVIDLVSNEPNKWPEPTLEVILEDERIKGWVQSSKFYVQPGTLTRIAELEFNEQGELFDHEEWINVYVETLKPNEAEWLIFPFPIFFSRHRENFSDGLTKLEKNLHAIAGDWDKSDVPFYERSTYPEFERTANGNKKQLALDFFVEIQKYIREFNVSDSSYLDRLSGMMENAYILGRIVREWELKSQFELDALKGKKRTQQGMSGGVARGEQKKAAANRWHRPTISWVQSLIDEEYSIKPLTFSKVAGLICSNWATRPFNEGPSEAPDHLYLVQTLLPRWEREEGLRRLPSGAPLSSDAKP